MSEPNIMASRDEVVVEGVTIRRPARLSIGQWLDYWEDNRLPVGHRIEAAYQRGYDEGYRAAKRDR